MTDLEELIAWWRMTKETQEWLWGPYQLEVIIKTIKALEELKKLKGE